MELAAPSSFGLPDLARNQASKFRSQARRLSLFRLVRQPAISVAGWAARRVALHYAERFAQQAIWFGGATAAVKSLEYRERHIDPRDALRASLDDVERQSEEIAAGCAELVAKLRSMDGKARGGVRDALTDLERSAGRLSKSVRAFKGAVQAHDANVDALRQMKRKPAFTPEALESELGACLN